MKVVIESNDIDELYGSDIEKPDMYILLSLKFYILCHYFISVMCQCYILCQYL